MGAYPSGLVKNARISMKGATTITSLLLTTEINLEWDKKTNTELLKEVESHKI